MSISITKKISLSLKNIRHHWNNIRQDVEIEDIKLHDLKRTFASIALSSNVSLDQIGEILNHKNINTTKTTLISLILKNE